MLPTVVAQDMRNAVSEFLRSAFPIANPYFQQSEHQPQDRHALINDLINTPGALFKGPYLDIKLPFRVAASAQLPFRHLSLPFTPYQHQLHAFERLAGDDPQSTIIATGTGSGKTECFMLPIIEDCLNRRERGIKAIVIYPMNALATDQAKRFAREVAQLDTRLTVGLFIGMGEGGGGRKKSQGQSDVTTTMSADQVITCQTTLRENPPDILLTNYKMLDYLLIRPGDQPLWRFNTPGLLRYLVVDELHTFDGAQGTDLACLIRRLKYRLRAGSNMACVGTSATLGSGHTQPLKDYASKIFASPFDEHSIVAEDRLSAQEYLARLPSEDSDTQTESLIRYRAWPVQETDKLNPQRYSTPEEYLFHQVRIWFREMSTRELPMLTAKQPRDQAEARVRLGELLFQHEAFHQLIRVLDHELVDVNSLARDWQRGVVGDDKNGRAHWMLVSLVSLVAHARNWQQRDSADPEQWTAPFLHVRQQLWLRELRRMVCSLGHRSEPRLMFSDDITDPQAEPALPLLHCRECHLAAWGARAKRDSAAIDTDLQGFYQDWFGNQPNVRLLIPMTDQDLADSSHDAVERQWLCPGCRTLYPCRSQGEGPEAPTCADCTRSGEGQALIPVWVPSLIRDIQRRDGETVRKAHHDCPACSAKEAMTIVGYRAASLVSVMSSRLFGTSFNDDRKLIAFSDSVQDAAHRAGFLEANTWRTVVRTAMVYWLNQQSVGLSLRDMADLLPEFWRQELGSDEDFVGTFVPPNLAGESDFEQLQSSGRLRAGSELRSMVERRLRWEVIAEWGRRSRIGRSLERQGLASVRWDISALRADLSEPCRRLREELGSLSECTEDQLLPLVLGWFQHARYVGAIQDPVLEGYIRNKGNFYLLNNIPWMPGFGRTQSPPAPLSLTWIAGNFETLVPSRGESWCVSWLKRTLGHEALFVAAEARHLFQILFRHLARTGWLCEQDVSGETVWLLNPERMMIEPESVAQICDHCGHRHPVHPAMVDALDGAPCSRQQCTGHRYQDVTLTVQRAGVSAAHPHRLVPHEHTGLLPRDRREIIEQSFIRGGRSWDINVLSATPTLEMGIDIGDLSSVMLCSVPPAQANYLQRIGRAGRRDGNALAVTVANGQNHDLYFYGEPRDMMAGSVDTPGVFLQAVAVLERQLLAFCLDCWVAGDVGDDAIPPRMSAVLDAAEREELAQFPYNLLSFISERSEDLLSEFFSLFNQLDSTARDYLMSHLSGQHEQTLWWRMTNRLQEKIRERTDYRKKTDQLKRAADALKRQPQDESTAAELAEVERERNALLSLLRELNQQPVLNFMTDEGLLPNYAFPEQGVTLKSVVLKRLHGLQREGADRQYTKTTYSLQRSAQAALGELAPENHFYAVSYRMPIERIDLGLSQQEQWRFCDRCQHNERVDTEDQHSACPRCFSPQWADSQQKQTVLRLRQVYSTVNSRRDRIGDDSDQREPAFYNRQMLVTVPEGVNTGGFRLDSDQLPFGFEFLSRVTLREVNFGPRGVDTHQFSVAGEERPRKGFRVCRHCGMVQKQRGQGGQSVHAYTCPLRGQPDQATDGDFLDSLYLYRELASEAIRILLPLSQVAYSDRALHSFIAVFNLGLRQYFRGDVHHLEVTEVKEPARDGQAERIYLVVYDKVPGGTGYLKELMRDSSVMFEVLKRARRQLENCVCNGDEHKDGCYRCILAYRNSRNMTEISRDEAAALLAQILALQDQVISIDSLDEVSTNSLIESKLEKLMLDALANLPGAALSPYMINGKPGWMLTLNSVTQVISDGPDSTSGNPVAWYVEHQVNTGPNQGAAMQTSIDMVLTPVQKQTQEQVRPLAIYVDGLQYHRDIVDDDVAKRMGVLLGGRYWVFSFNWDDIPQPGKPGVKPDAGLLSPTGTGQSKALTSLYDKAASRVGWQSSEALLSMQNWPSMRWLEAYLADPVGSTELFRQYAFLQGFRHLDMTSARVQRRHDEIVGLFRNCDTAEHMKQTSVTFGETVLGAVSAGSPHSLLMMPALEKSALETNELEAMLLGELVVLHFDDTQSQTDDDFKGQWRSIWWLANQFQFLPRFSLTSRKAIDSGVLGAVWADAERLREHQNQSASAAARADWTQVLELSLLPEEILNRIVGLGLPVPDVGLDIRQEDGAVVLSGEIAELVWQEQKVMVLSESLGNIPDTLSDWVLLVDGDELVDQLAAMKQKGTWEEEA